MAPTAGANKTVWDAELRSELLLAFFRHAPPSSEEWGLIIDEMQAKGHTFNANAAQQHLAKLRKKAPAAGGGDKAPAASASGAATNNKKPRAKNGGKRKAKQDDADADSNDGEEENAAPAPKKRIRKPKAEAKPQAEDGESLSVPSYTAWQPVPAGMNMTAEEYNALAPNPLANDEA